MPLFFKCKTQIHKYTDILLEEEAEILATSKTSSVPNADKIYAASFAFCSHMQFLFHSSIDCFFLLFPTPIQGVLIIPAH